MVATGNPARVSMRIWRAPPVAAPPGSAWLSALPESWEVATSNQPSVSRATRISNQMHPNASASSTKMGTNQAGNTPSSCGRLPNVAIRLGATIYSATPVIRSIKARPTSLRPRRELGLVLRGERVIAQRRLPGCVMRLIASARVLESSLNEPRTAEVIVSDPGFWAPRIDMHMCSASIITSTPAGSSLSISASAICVVSRSCTCGRRAKPSTRRAIFDRPVMRPSTPGM